MKFALVSILFFAFSTGFAFAERTGQGAGRDARVRFVVYNPVDVVRVDTSLLVNTAIELGRGERVRSVLLGDSESFEVDVLSSGDVISVKPVIAGAFTNLTVYTNRRTYYFSLTVGRSQVPTFRLAFNYPDDQPRQTSNAPKTAVFRNVGYQVSGQGELRPRRIWNDGTHTYFEFAGSVRPSIFAATLDGRERTTNSTTRGSVVRVSGVGRNYTIRLGDAHACVRLSENPRIANDGLNSRLAAIEAQGWR